jgi:hypothetical protein
MVTTNFFAVALFQLQACNIGFQRQEKNCRYVHIQRNKRASIVINEANIHFDAKILNMQSKCACRMDESVVSPRYDFYWHAFMVLTLMIIQSGFGK